MTAAPGVALLASLFLPWFDGVSGWEHFVWADVGLTVVALVLIAAVRPIAPLRVLAVVLCGLGVAVVLGHGFAPDQPPRSEEDIGVDVLAGAYVALAALALGAIGGLAAWPRRGGAVLLVAAGAGIVAALLSGWGSPDGTAVFFGELDDIRVAEGYQDGFERWKLLDVALLAFALALLVAAVRRLPRVAYALLGAAAVAAAACVAIGMRGQLWVDEGIADGAAKGPLVALLALAAALAGLVLVRPPAAASGAPSTPLARAARAG